MTGCINHAFKALKEKNALIINKLDITKLTNAVYSESHSVLSFMVCAFHELTFLQSGIYTDLT